MTLREYSKLTGLNIKKVYNYSKYQSFYNSSLPYSKYKDLPFCVRLSIIQVLSNLICIKKETSNMPISSALIKSGFKIYSVGFLDNIMNGFNINNKHNIDKYLKIEHIDKLIIISKEFIK